MNNYNKAIVMGNIVRDPEVRYTPSGTAVCNFTVASNHKYKDKEEILYLDVVAWGKKGETIADFMSKGKPILVEGRLKMDEWEDKDGKKRTKIKLNLESFNFVGPKEAGEDNQKSQDSSGDEDAPF